LAISLLEPSASGHGINYDCRHGYRWVGRSDAGLVMKLHFNQLLCLTLLLVPTAVLADYQDDIGYRSLEDHVQLLSKGANIRVGQVEAPMDGAYMPDRTSLAFIGKHILPPNIFSYSGHATMVGGMFYGRDGIAPGTRDITIFDSTSFLISNNKALRVGQQGLPKKLDVSVLNNSWIASFTSEAQNIEAVRRLDFVINRDDVVVVSSVDNNTGSAYPKLLATSYNGISVGVLGGDGSSGGPIKFDSRGYRVKPDMVVPTSEDLNTTSQAAGAVSGAAALIRSEAKARHMNVSELTTKAILLAGANRPDDWERGAAGSYDDEKVPLDYRYGAGSLRVDNSFDILLSGRHSAGGVKSGWDTSMARKKNHVYSFNISADDDDVDELDDDDEHDAVFTAVLTWNRQIKRGARGALTSSMADLEIALLIKNGRKWMRVSKSDSDYDNVETITLRDLAPGAYRLVVRGDRPEPYSVAWFTSDEDHHGGNSGPGGGDPLLEVTLAVGGMAPTAVPEPGVMGLLVTAAALLMRRKSRAFHLS
jgi:hypothetical protein